MLEPGAVAERCPPEQYSSDQFKTWSRCRKKYDYQYLRRLNWPTDQSHFRLGKSVHKLLEFQSRHLDCTLLLQDAEADVRQAWEALMAHPIAQFPIVASEWGFHVPVENEKPVWLTGRVDRIAQDGDTILVLDWKTGTGVPTLPEMDWQTILYLYAVVEAATELGHPGLTPEQVRFVYVEVKNGEVREVPVPYDTERHIANGEKIRQTIREIQAAAAYDLPKKCPDPFCPYSAVCGIRES